MKKIAVATSTRADYGLLRPVLQKLFARKDVETQLLVTGTHLSHDYGYTADEIKADKFPIAAELDFLDAPAPEGRLGTAWRVMEAYEQFVGYFGWDEAQPDIFLVLGDRYEIFAAAQAAAILDIPVAHISGGDVTHGADDDWFRHCITKMAKLHFPTCEEYRCRVLRMGEQPDKVFNVGGLGDENIRNMQLMSKEELQESLQLATGVPDVIVTFHPETATNVPPAQQMMELLHAVEENPQLTYLFTAANADAGGTIINEMAEAFCSQRKNTAMIQSLGALRYLSCMKYAKLVLGNSSSGLAETPSFGIPTVNIGHRQDGRLVCDNVINCEATKSEISAAIQKATGDDFSEMARRVKSPFNGGDTSGKIVELLVEFAENGALVGPKIFYDGSDKA